MAIEGWVGLGIGLLGYAALVLAVARQPSRPSGSARAAQVAIVSIGSIWVLVGVVVPSFVFAAWGAIHLGTAGGIAIGSRWAHALEVVLGMITVLGVGFVAFFSIALTMSAGGDLGRPMLGTGVFGVLNGWVSLLVFALFIGSGTFMVFAGLHGSARIARLVDDRPGSAAPTERKGEDSDG
jgi:hypothetical protein